MTTFSPSPPEGVEFCLRHLRFQPAVPCLAPSVGAILRSYAMCQPPEHRLRRRASTVAGFTVEGRESGELR